ncbi:MAG: hypothetical protein E6J85_01875 [Deltaproteobacteria bacterium]|nr:MAG: hypothetical protein E6J85_01875 [Deltaproteobacteria bacterium]
MTSTHRRCGGSDRGRWSGEAYDDEILQPRKRSLSPWESVETAGLRITAVPARHQGGRYGVDALWNHACTGYVIEGFGHRIFFAGDTGYDARLFHEIADRFPGIEIAFIPIAPGRRKAAWIAGGTRTPARPSTSSPTSARATWCRSISRRTTAGAPTTEVHAASWKRRSTRAVSRTGCSPSTPASGSCSPRRARW